MLFWHNQPEHLWPSPEEPYPGPTSSLLRESLPLPYLKQEELPSIPRQEPPCLAFQYVLCAATSPAVKQQEEALTYLNQGQSYEVQMLCNSKLGDATQWPQLLKIHCISTEFTPRKKGGEKGVPFCLQVDTFKPSDKELLPEHLHSAGCLIKVFKPKGADRKLKTDQEKIEKQPLFQTACESTVFVECSLWPEPSAGPYQPLSPLTSPNSCKFLSPERLCCSPPFVLDTLAGSPAEDLNPAASVLETQQWSHWHRVSSCWRTRANFTGTDLLKLTRQDLIQICGAADGIRLFNTLRARPTRHRLTLYVAQAASRQENEVPKNPDSGFYEEISLDELRAVELMGKLAEVLALPANQIHRLFHQGPGGILILLNDQVVQNLKDESYFVAVVKKVQNADGYYLVLT
uniref:Grh/CP2 DB domain-containing protein n=2 Tax=Rousettus aegyptiacus TaxID=9407 RepID=A0A7J8GAK9_ROUAE|nr:hypothetical protein HJG63_011692 [Rousettus aegyptiacus]